jgi:hypothetical protein
MSSYQLTVHDAGRIICAAKGEEEESESSFLIQLEMQVTRVRHDVRMIPCAIRGRHGKGVFIVPP